MAAKKTDDVFSIASIDPSKLSESFREFAEKGATQTKEAYAKMKEAAEDATKTVEATLESAQAGSVELGLKAIEANVAAQQARREETIVAYRQTVQQAFRETHDALVVNRKAREALAAQAQRRAALEQALALADLRYRAGYSGYLEVLDAQRELLQAQTLEIAAARDARNALVDLARALGGGWSPEAFAAAQR